MSAVLSHPTTIQYIYNPLLTYKYALLGTLAVVAVSFQLYRLVVVQLEKRRENYKKEEQRKKTRLNTLYEILVSERQFYEYIKFLYEQYYLPIERGDSSCQLEYQTLVPPLKLDAIKKDDGELNVNAPRRNIIDFSKIYEEKDPSCVLIPHEIENIFLLSGSLLRSLESEILGWHETDRVFYNIYRYSMAVIGNIFKGKEEVDLDKTDSPSSTNSSPSTPLTPKGGNTAVNAAPSDGKSIENFGYLLRSVRENCNIVEKCLKPHMDAFVIYGFYVSKFNDCRININEMASKNESFKNNLKLARTLKGCNSLDLASLSVMVPQRLPRIILFLKQLAKCTHLNDVQFKEIEQAIKEAERITFKVNAFVKDYQSRMQVVNLRSHLVSMVPHFGTVQDDETLPQLVQSHRRVVGSFKVTPLVEQVSNQSGSQSARLASTTSVPTIEIHVFNDILIVYSSMTKYVKPKVAETTNSGNSGGFFGGLLTPRKKVDSKHHAVSMSTTDILTTANIHEIYYADIADVNVYSPAGGGGNILILEMSKCKCFSSKNDQCKQLTKMFHLNKKEESAQLFADCFEKHEEKSRSKKEFTLTETEAGDLLSNYKLLTLLVPDNLLLTQDVE